MKGFTLIETLVAVSIITIAVAGPLYTAGRAIVATQIARDQLTASYLAQEGIEYMRMVRDDNYLADNSSAWDNFTAAVVNCTAPKACTLDPWSSTLSFCPDGGSGTSVCADPLYLDDGRYTQNNTTGTRTSFVREIQVSGAGNERKITSKVSWNAHGTNRSVIITDHLTPWQ